MILHHATCREHLSFCSKYEGLKIQPRAKFSLNRVRDGNALLACMLEPNFSKEPNFAKERFLQQEIIQRTLFWLQTSVPVLMSTKISLEYFTETGYKILRLDVKTTQHCTSHCHGYKNVDSLRRSDGNTIVLRPRDRLYFPRMVAQRYRIVVHVCFSACKSELRIN